MVPAATPYASDGTMVNTSISGTRPSITGAPAPVSEPSAARSGEAAGQTAHAKAADQRQRDGGGAPQPGPLPAA